MKSGLKVLHRITDRREKFVATIAAMKSGLKAPTTSREVYTQTRSNHCRDEKRTESIIFLSSRSESPCSNHCRDEKRTERLLVSNASSC